MVLLTYVRKVIANDLIFCILAVDKQPYLCYDMQAFGRKHPYGRVVELVDSLDSGSSVHCGRAGSSPASPTKNDSVRKKVVVFSIQRYNLQ